MSQVEDRRALPKGLQNVPHRRSHSLAAGKQRNRIKMGFSSLVELLVDAVSRYLVRQVEAGAEVLQIFDSWAGVLPEGALRRWSLEPIAEIIRRVKQRCPGVPITQSNDRASAPLCRANSR